MGSKLKRLFVFLCAFLLVSLHLVIGSSRIETNIAAGDTDFIGEISHGFVSGSYGVDLWYVWLNTSGAHLLFLTMYSVMYPAPVNYFIGQHYFTANGTEVFVGNRLLGFEIYDDINKNSVIDADFNDGFNNALDETRYFFMLNASQTVDLTPPSKNVVDNVAHYTWSVKYRQVQGNIAEIGNVSGSYIADPETDEMVPSFFTGGWSATLDQLNFIFDYWVENNASYLKIGLEFGTFWVLKVSNPSPQPAFLTFDNKSLSVLCTTSVLSLEPFQISIKNPQKVGEAIIANSTSIEIERQEAFKLVFGENYTLQGRLTPYKSIAGVYSLNSLPGDVIYHAKYFTQDTENILKEYLGKVSTSLSGNITLGVRKSSLIYRICYPTWGNRALSYDPLYIAYMGESSFRSQGSAPPPLTLLIATIILSMAVLMVAVRQHIKISKNKKSHVSLNRFLLCQARKSEF